MKTCVNHPEKDAFSICHSCRQDFCESCLDEGKEYYYCKKPECQKLLVEELGSEFSIKNVVCPNCKSELELSEEEGLRGKIHCPECDEVIDFSIDPPKILDIKNYVELLSSLNQGDIAVIKSLLDDGNIDYFVVGENFLNVRPLLEPLKFFVNECHLELARELLKNFDLNIFGFSNKQD